MGSKGKIISGSSGSLLSSGEQTPKEVPLQQGCKPWVGGSAPRVGEGGGKDHVAGSVGAGSGV